MLLKKYRNLLLELIQRNGIDPKLFRAEDTRDKERKVFAIHLIDTPMTFFAYNPTHDYYSFMYSYKTFTPSFSQSAYVGLCSEATFIKGFTEWLKNHVQPFLREQIEPDLWEQIEYQKPLTGGAKVSQEDKASFSEDEKRRIRMSLNEYRLLLLKNFEPSSDELKVIDERLTYLSDSVDRLNRMDWRSVAFTALIAISTALSLDTEKGRLLFELFRQVFSGLLYLIQ